MNITYTITEKMRKKLASRGENFDANQEVYMSDPDVADILVNDPRVKIANGKLKLDLAGPILTNIEKKAVWAQKSDGAAAGIIYRNVFTAETPPLPPTICSTSMMHHEFEYVITTPANLVTALKEIDDINVSREQEAKHKTAEQLDTFQARIDKYNIEHETKEIDSLREKIESLKEEIKILLKENEKLSDQVYDYKKAVITEIVNDGYIDTTENSNVRYILERYEE